MNFGTKLRLRLKKKDGDFLQFSIGVKLEQTRIDVASEDVVFCFAMYAVWHDADVVKLARIAGACFVRLCRLAYPLLHPRRVVRETAVVWLIFYRVLRPNEADERPQ